MLLLWSREVNNQSRGKKIIVENYLSYVGRVSYMVLDLSTKGDLQIVSDLREIKDDEMHRS